jgi:hypothetical protein
MWIALFAIVSAAALCLGVAAFVMQPVAAVMRPERLRRQ